MTCKRGLIETPERQMISPFASHQEARISSRLTWTRTKQSELTCCPRTSSWSSWRPSFNRSLKRWPWPLSGTCKQIFWFEQPNCYSFQSRKGSHLRPHNNQTSSVLSSSKLSKDLLLLEFSCSSMPRSSSNSESSLCWYSEDIAEWILLGWPARGD